MATYKQIQEYVKSVNEVSVDTCQIAHVKSMHGINMRPAPNRISPDSRVYECPENFVPLIEQAMKHFGMIS